MCLVSRYCCRRKHITCRCFACLMQVFWRLQGISEDTRVLTSRQANHMQSASSDFSSGNIDSMGWLQCCKTERVVSFLRLKRRKKKKKIQNCIFAGGCLLLLYLSLNQLWNFYPVKTYETEFCRKKTPQQLKPNKKSIRNINHVLKFRSKCIP